MSAAAPNPIQKMQDELTAFDAEKAKQPQPLTKCPHCGWAEGAQPKPKQEDLEEYLRCVLGDKLFSKTYDAYKGELRLKFTSLASKDVDGLNNLLFSLSEENQNVLQDIAMKLKLMYFLTAISKGGKTDTVYAIPTGLDSKAMIDAEFNKRFGTTSEPIMRVLGQAVLVFIELQALLVNEAFDKNFWSSAGPY